MQEYIITLIVFEPIEVLSASLNLENQHTHINLTMYSSPAKVGKAAGLQTIMIHI